MIIYNQFLIPMKTISNGKIDPSIKEVLKKLVNIDLDFYVIGGLLCQFYLKEHARYTKDVDIVFYSDPEKVKKELKKAYGLIDFSYEEETERFYEPSFTCFTWFGELRGQIEGRRIDFFKEIKAEEYSYEGIKFKGVCIEYGIADKITSLLNELSRPYKHLVDIYSFTKIDQSLIDKKEIKRYMSLINEQENKFRKKIGLKELELPKQIPQDKVFTAPIVVPTLQSKYNVSKETMLAEVNDWLKTVL